MTRPSFADDFLRDWAIFTPKGDYVHVAEISPGDYLMSGHSFSTGCLCEPRVEGKLVTHQRIHWLKM